MAVNKLQSEIAHYDANLAAFVGEHRDEFVLIKGSRVMGFYKTEREALDTGYNSFGNQPFLVRQCVENRTPVMFISL